MKELPMLNVEQSSSSRDSPVSSSIGSLPTGVLAPSGRPSPLLYRGTWGRKLLIFLFKPLRRSSYGGPERRRSLRGPKEVMRRISRVYSYTSLVFTLALTIAAAFEATKLLRGML